MSKIKSYTSEPKISGSKILEVIMKLVSIKMPFKVLNEFFVCFSHKTKISTWKLLALVFDLNIGLFRPLLLNCQTRQVY